MSASELLDEKELLAEIAVNEDDEGVLDTDALSEEGDESDSTTTYEITSYGADFDVEGLVRRLERGDIYAPSFQRKYVWKQSDASKFIESLLLGFPVPAVFLSKETDGKMLIVDGQQRLETIRSYYSGLFGDRQFKLVGIRSRFANKTYSELDSEDQRRLDNSLIHTIIVQPNAPEEPANNVHSSIYLLFDRLNSGGRPLFPQEIRASIAHGEFIELLHKLNEDGYWRELYGKRSPRLKDEELILRFLALYYDAMNYQAPMKTFLDSFCSTNRDLPNNTAQQFRQIFEETVRFVHTNFGKNAFRPIKAFNAAFFDAISVATAKRLSAGPIQDIAAMKQAYNELLHDTSFLAAYSQTTSRREQVQSRLDIAATKLATVP